MLPLPWERTLKGNEVIRRGMELQLLYCLRFLKNKQFRVSSAIPYYMKKDGYRKYLELLFDVARNKLTPEKYMSFIKEAKSKVKYTCNRKS